MHTATADPLIGRLLEGRYRIVDRIARGGMSTVYAALDERLDRRVAVKVMASALSADPVFVDRFAREARAAARLTHVNAVAVYDQGHDTSGERDHVFLVMELVQGRTLRELMRDRRSRFSPAEAVSLMEPVLSALSGAHRAGLVHRDVKPENILIGDDGIVKVADFGLAGAIDSDVASTQTSLMMGTVAYCAPEQIVAGRADQRSDVYSAGIMLFELLTGRPPFEGDSPVSVAYQHVHRRVPPPSARVRGIPGPVDRLVLAATERDPERRLRDAAAFLAELADVRSRLQLPIVAVATRPAAQRARGVRAPAPNGKEPPARLRAAAPTTDLLAEHAAAGEPRVVELGTTFRAPAGRSASSGTLPARAHTVPDSHRRTTGPAPATPPPPRVRTPRQQRRRRRLVALIVVLLLGAAAAIGGWRATRWYRSWDSHVPALTGKSVSSARDVLERSGYSVGRQSFAYSETVSSGSIIATDPAAGSRLKQGSAVDVTVSRGQNRVAVPTLRAVSLFTAYSTLEAHGLRFASTPRQRPSVRLPRGQVLGSDPAAGALVRPHAVITLIVSSGPPLVDVPAMTSDVSCAAADKELRGAHLVPRRETSYDDTIPTGHVIGVDPSDRARWGSTVTVTCSLGPEYVTVPDIGEGTSITDAKNQLEALGLVVSVDQYEPGPGIGMLMSTDPGPGTRVRVGSTVVLKSI